MKKLLFVLILIQFSISCTAWAAQEKVQFMGADGVQLQARLYAPDHLSGPKKKAPALLILDSTAKPWLTDDSVVSPLLQLSEKLADEGFVVLTLHKRGTGDNAQNGSYWKATFEQDQTDAQAAFNLLKSNAHVNADKIFLVGHGIAGPQALKLADKNPVAGTVMLASTIRYVGDVQLEQTKLNLTLQEEAPAKIESKIKILSQQIQDVKAGIFKCEAPACESIDGISVMDKTIPVPWWSEVLKMDFTEWALDVSSPILFVFGSSDFIIPETDYHYVRDVMRLHKTNHIETVRLKNLDHFMVENESLKASFQYAQQVQKDKKHKSVSPALVSELSNWIKKLPQPRKQAQKNSGARKRYL